MASTEQSHGGRGEAQQSFSRGFFDLSKLVGLTQAARDPADVAPLLMPTAEEEQAHREAIAARVASLVEECVQDHCKVLADDLRLVAQAGRNFFALSSSFSVSNLRPVEKVEELGLLTNSMHLTMQEIQKPDWLMVEKANTRLRRFDCMVWTHEPYQFFTLPDSACEEILNTTVDKIFQCDRERWPSEAKRLAEELVFERGVEDDAVFRKVVSAQKLSPKLSGDYQLGELIFGEKDHKQLRHHPDREPVNLRLPTVPTRMVLTSLVPFLAEKFRKAGFSVELCVHRMEWGYCGHKGYDILSNIRISWPGKKETHG